MTDPRRCLLFVLVLAALWVGCDDEKGDRADADAGNRFAGSVAGRCPADVIDAGKALLAAGDGDGARAVFLAARELVTGIKRLLEWLFGGTGKHAATPPPRGDGGKARGDVPQEPPAVGIDTATDIAALPYLFPTARTLQFSSHDPAGGNADGFAPPNHLYVDEHGEYVVFDQFGRGCIYRMWFTNTWSLIGNVRVYVDDLETPVLEGPFWLLFLSGFEPFTRPLVESWITSSGGCVSYLPIPFRARCRITVNVPPEFFNITYVRYDADTPVTSFTGSEDTSALRSQWNARGVDPKPVVPGDEFSGSATLGPGEQVEIVRRSGGGAVWSIRMGIEPFTQEAADRLHLNARWDGHEAPDVDASLPEFFGGRFIGDAPRGLLFGHDGERFYNYFPMPYWTGAVVTIANRGDAPVAVSWTVRLATDPYAAGAGYFRATDHAEDPVPVGRDYRIATREGAAGKYVGIVETMSGSLTRAYLEGDERFHVDGSASPSLHGTGTEDYYNSGWYFLTGTYDRALWGNPTHATADGRDLTGVYRVHVGDAVHYLNGARLGIEHGPDNRGGADRYSSLAFFYETDGVRLRRTEALDVGDPSSESAHGYVVAGGFVTAPLTSYFEGEDDETPFTDSGRVVEGESRFRIAIDPANAGVVLRRRFDQLQARQAATVLVDDVAVGTWYSPESSPHLRWAEDDFVLPPSATRGKSRLAITVRPSGPVPWTEFAYEAWSIGP
jgi:hypothetical protein